jgi:hypothetical protein
MVGKPIQKRRKERTMYVHEKRKRRREADFESDKPFHEQVQCSYNRFLTLIRGGKPKYEVVYDLYLDSVARGVASRFDEFDRDPMRASDLVQFKKRLKNMYDVIKQKKFEPLPISDEVRKSFYTKPKMEQKRILLTLAFEFTSFSLKIQTCTSCRSKILAKNFAGDHAYVCTKCVCLKNDQKLKMKPEEYYQQKNMLPVWYDNKGKIHYEVPDELQGLTQCEKMLIQRLSIYCPVYHIYNGNMGIKGHTCCFRKQEQDTVSTLPRSNIDLICVTKQSNNTSNDNHPEVHYLHARKSKVVSALNWLKLHHRGYKDIDIDETVLTWCTDEGSRIPDDRILSSQMESEEETIVQTATISATQEQMSTVEQGATMAECGEVTFNVTKKYSKNGYQAIEELKQKIKEMKLDIPEMSYPQVEDEPVDEYGIPHMFADAYPWLFPGGIGDGTSEPSSSELSCWAEMVLLYNDGRFMRDPIFSFHLMNFVQRHKNNQYGLYFLKDYVSDKDLILQDLKDKIEQGDTSFIERLQTFASQKLPGCDAFWRYKKKELDTWIMHHVEEGH